MIKAGWLRRDFLSQIWEALIVSDPVQSWGGGFSVTKDLIGLLRCAYETYNFYVY